MFLASLLIIIKCLHWLKSYGLHKILQPGEITENKWSNE